MSRRSSVIDFSFPENNDSNDKDRPPAPPDPPRPPWRADLLILLAASLATIGTFLFEAWNNTQSSAVVTTPNLEVAQPDPPG